MLYSIRVSEFLKTAIRRADEAAGSKVAGVDECVGISNEEWMFIRCFKFLLNPGRVVKLQMSQME